MLDASAVVDAGEPVCVVDPERLNGVLACQVDERCSLRRTPLRSGAAFTNASRGSRTAPMGSAAASLVAALRLSRAREPRA